MYSYLLHFRDFYELTNLSVLTYFSGFLHATPPQVAYIIGMIFHCLKMFHQTSFTT